ncbi:hypothetical protein BDV38DRAFT_238780 [Aspergillus pseudotamarii]|uniref:Uncharacterized protein n=1 Tax=Aspergillus pseudotamarii TaxID=132259 RepID=A0A5N6T4B1_ASPPS|nr:uncharacterized protein BDV38DRAFT_238780 [Aspergillus pseudotamarii]KAE8141137.1 hypothetical protein BDV38DRAFT_238780 [Aspergillus pseudotamarii]
MVTLTKIATSSSDNVDNSRPPRVTLQDEMDNHGVTQCENGLGKMNYNLTQELCTLQHDRCSELGAETKH